MSEVHHDAGGGLTASMIQMLHVFCPQGQEITPVLIRTLESGNKEWVVLTCHEGRVRDISAYLAAIGIGRFTDDHRLRGRLEALDIVQTLGRRLYGDEHALGVFMQ